MTLSAAIARRRLEAILLEDRTLTPAQDVKDDALRRVREDFPRVMIPRRDRRVTDLRYAMNPDDYECPHDWTVTDDSFDHEFGTHRIEPYLECNVCGETAPRPRE